nr:ferrochelatase [Acidimicrobiia bacterium]
MAGLAAAFALAGRGDVRVTLYEADERFGGKVRSEAFAGLDLDLGPDAYLARRAEGVLVCPCGFVSDHLEVLYDLDVEARDRAAALGLAFARTA